MDRYLKKFQHFKKSKKFFKKMDANSDCIILIESREANVFKSLTEFYHATMPLIIFKVSVKGLFSSIDNKKQENKGEKFIPETLLANLELWKHKFSKFVIPNQLYDDEDAELPIIAEALNMKNACAGILKKDLFRMSIKKSDPNKLHIDILNEEKGRKIHNVVSLLSDEHPQVIPRLKPASPYRFDMTMPTAVCESKEFQKVCKANTAVKASLIKVQAQYDPETKMSGVRFNLSNGELERNFYFGDWNDNGKVMYDQNFPIKANFAPLQKVCSLSTQVNIYCKKEVGLMLVSVDVEKSGRFDVYFVASGTGA
jgi:hypothetical protein